MCAEAWMLMSYINDHLQHHVSDTHNDDVKTKVVPTFFVYWETEQRLFIIKHSNYCSLHRRHILGLRRFLIIKIFPAVAQHSTVSLSIRAEAINKTSSRPKRQIELCEMMKLLMKQPESVSEI